MIRPSARSFALLGVVVLSFLAVKPRVDAQTSSLAGSYELVARHSGKCLDVSGVSMDDGAPVIQWTCNGGLNQRWTLQPASDGYYNLVAGHSGKTARRGWRLDRRRRSGHPVDGQRRTESAVASAASRRRLLHAHGAPQRQRHWTSPACRLDDGAPAIQWTPNGGDESAVAVAQRRRAAGPSAADATRFLEQATWGPTPALVQHVQDRRLRALPRRAVRDAGVELSDAAALSDDARYDRLSERIDLPARQLHDVSGAEPVLRERRCTARINCGSASPSRFIRSSSSPASTSRSRAG